MKLIFATNNSHKFTEIVDMLDPGIELYNLRDMGFSGSIPETHDTLEENAIEKADFIYNKYGINCIADDTGLLIDALKGEPGVYSARYAGDNCSFEDNINKVLVKMKGVKDRRARFLTIIALVENGKVRLFKGTIEGEIIKERRGDRGFGYDSIFFPAGYTKTFSEMGTEEKNKISHRARAFKNLVDYLNNK